MPYKLPSGRVIDQTKKGAYFILDGVRHNETSLDKWSDEQLAKYGITREAPPKPVVYKPDMVKLKAIYSKQLREEVEGLLRIYHGPIVQAALNTLDPLGNQAVITEHALWVKNVLVKYYDALDKLDTAATADEVYAVKFDIDSVVTTAPNTDFGALINPGSETFHPKENKEA